MFDVRRFWNALVGQDWTEQVKSYRAESAWVRLNNDGQPVHKPQRLLDSSALPTSSAVGIGEVVSRSKTRLRYWASI